MIHSLNRASKNMLPKSLALFTLLAIFVCLVNCSIGNAQDPTPQEKRAVRAIKSNIDRALADG